MNIIDHVSAAIGPESVLTQPNPKYILILLKIVEKVVMYKIDRRGETVQKLYTRTDPTTFSKDEIDNINFFQLFCIV